MLFWTELYAKQEYKRSWQSLDSFFWIPLQYPVWSSVLVSRWFRPHPLQASSNRAVVSSRRWQEEVITKRKSYHSLLSIIFSSSVCLRSPCSSIIPPCTSQVAANKSEQGAELPNPPPLLFQPGFFSARLALPLHFATCPNACASIAEGGVREWEGVAGSRRRWGSRRDCFSGSEAHSLKK